MKYSMWILSLLVSFAAGAMEEKIPYAQFNKEKSVINTTVGQAVELNVFACDQWTNVFYSTSIKPDEAILRFIEEKNAAPCNANNMVRTVKVKYQALQKGKTDVQYGLYATAFCKALGTVSYTVEVE